MKLPPSASGAPSAGVAARKHPIPARVRRRSLFRSGGFKSPLDGAFAQIAVKYLIKFTQPFSSSACCHTVPGLSRSDDKAEGRESTDCCYNKGPAHLKLPSRYGAPPLCSGVLSMGVPVFLPCELSSHTS
jgi:hypothetical protein